MPTATDITSELKQLLLNKDYLKVPKEGDLITGTAIAISPREILVDLNGYKTGVIRGYELQDKETLYPVLKVGDVIEATVLELENDEGHVELSLRFAGKTRAWESIKDLHAQGAPVEVKITDTNRGGLMAFFGNVPGFIPVSQLAPENYPRVPGGDKGKILEKLRSFMGTVMRVKILDFNPAENKLIFSEKALWEDEQKDLLQKYKIGDTLEGTVSAIADFGVFVAFDGLEGLVHISEIVWQRLDHPSDVIKIGDKVRAQVLNIQGSKIFLSMKALQEDPWKLVGQRYAIDQQVRGKVLKVNPFGLFVELDPDIHGLAHVSELNIQPGIPLEEQIKSGDQREFKIVSIEPEHHRLGLSEKALKREEAPIPKPPPAEQTGAIAEDVVQLRQEQ